MHLYLAICRGDLEGIRHIVGSPEHTLFSPVCAIAAAGHHALAQLTPHGDFSRFENVMVTAWMGGAVLAVLSALNIGWVYRLARRTGAEEREAAFAALLAAATCTGFFHARHQVPYLIAVGCALLALIVGTGATTARRAGGAGLLIGATFHLYNGYWFLVPALSLALAWWWRRSADRWRWMLACALGVAIALVLPLGVGMAAAGGGYLSYMREFSQTVTQGLFAEGWSLPWEYLWHAEGGLGIAVALAVAGASLIRIWQRRSQPARVHLWWLLLSAIYALIVLGSVALEWFVVYGRTVLPFTPFLCLLGGWALAQIIPQRRAFSVLAAVAIMGVAFVQLRPHFEIIFPRQFERAVVRSYGNPKRTFTFAGSLYTPTSQAVDRPELLLVNGQMLYPLRAPLPIPDGTTLLKLPHVLSVPVYQYEAYSPRERALLREHGIWMSLMQLARPDEVPDHPPPAWRFRGTDRPTGR